MDEKEKVTNEVKKNNEKAKSKNAVILLIVLGIALLVVVGLVILQQVKMNKPEIGGQDNTELNIEDKEQNVQDNTSVNVYQEKVEDKEDEEQKEDVENKEESQNSNEDANTESKKPQKEEQEQVKVDFDELVNEMYNKEAVKDLPKLTAEERVSYQKEWDESLTEMIKENEKRIKKKYPTLSDDKVRTYAIQFTEYIKEDTFRITKANRELKDKAENAVESSELANARSVLAIKYAEVLAGHYTKDPTQSYKINESDLKILQQHVLEKSDGKYTVIIKQDNSGYDVVKVVN